jgi:hypothetical protein
MTTRNEVIVTCTNPSHAKLARLSAALESALGQLVKKRDEWSSEPFRLRKPCADSLAPFNPTSMNDYCHTHRPKLKKRKREAAK